MPTGNVIDQFGDDNGLAHSCTAEQPGLATLFQRRQQIDNFDACFNNLRGYGALT